MAGDLERALGGLGYDAWWIIILFFLFLSFGDTWSEIVIIDWIPFLILLLIVCCCISPCEVLGLGEGLREE